MNEFPYNVLRLLPVLHVRLFSGTHHSIATFGPCKH